MAQAASALDLSTPAFKQGEKIPSNYTCDAAGMNPALNFSGVPANTKQLVLTLHDPDVPKTLMPSGNFDHWMVWDIAPTSKGIAEGAGSSMGMNGTGKAGTSAHARPTASIAISSGFMRVDTPLRARRSKTARRSRTP